MKDIIKLENGQEITLDNNLAWLMEYQDQFGEDILPTLMPLVMSFADLLGSLADSGADLDNVSVTDLLRILKSDEAMDAFFKFSAFKTTDLINIVWALAKTADDSIDPPKKWIRQFEEGFPFDTIMPKAAVLIGKGVISSKKWERLATAAEKLKPAAKEKKKTSRSTRSSSQASSGA